MSAIAKQKTPANARVVVIGAGASGIAAATRLLEAGFKNVLMLEAENRIGGRIHTLPFADNVIDLGAQWCHGEQRNAIYELVKDRGMLEPTGDYYETFKCVRSNGELVEPALAEQLQAIGFNSIPERQADLPHYEGSLGAYLTEKYWQEANKIVGLNRTIAAEYLQYLKKFECSVEASDNLFEVSGKGHLEYWLCDGELLLNWKDKGFVSFLQLLMQTPGNASNELGVLSQRILFNKRVQHIDYGQANIEIKCRCGQIIEADHVICTASLGVLQENHERMFSPPLPLTKRRAIQGLRIGSVNKFFLEFAEPFGPLDWSGIGFLWREQDLQELRQTKNFWLESVFGFFGVSHQKRLLEGWIIGPHSRHMETLPEQQVKEAIMWLFRKFLKFPVPEPINFVRTQWYSNPNFRGTYSFRSMYTEELRTGASELATPLYNEKGQLLLQFAGEATHDHYYSSVHGAVESGWREANRLIEYYETSAAKL